MKDDGLLPVMFHDIFPFAFPDASLECMNG